MRLLEVLLLFWPLFSVVTLAGVLVLLLLLLPLDAGGFWSIHAETNCVSAFLLYPPADAYTQNRYPYQGACTLG